MANSKLVEAKEKIAEGVVGGYKKIEERAVGGFNKIADKFVDNSIVIKKNLKKAERTREHQKTAGRGNRRGKSKGSEVWQTGKGSSRCFRKVQYE